MNTPRDIIVCKANVKAARLRIPVLVRYKSIPPVARLATNGMTCHGDLSFDIAAIRIKKP